MENSDGIHGLQKTWWDPEQTVLRSESIFIDGVLHGRCCTYRSNGELHTECLYSYGLLHGPWKIYFLRGDGRVQQETNFVNGKEDGMSRRWYPNGRLASQFPMVDGQRRGQVREWYEDGGLSTEYEMENNVMHGLYRIWEEGTGDLVLEGQFANGRRQGLWGHWTEFGYSEHEYLNGFEDGIARMWTSKDRASLLREGFMVNGRREGPWRYWYKDGGPMESEGVMENDKPVGVWRYWYRNGRQHLEKRYQGGLLWGSFVSWHDNGMLESQGSYYRDRMVGTWRHWTPDGFLSCSRDYPEFSCKIFNPNPCIIYKEPILPGDEFLICSFSDEHVHDYVFMIQFYGHHSAGTMKCQYCQHPMKDTVFVQELPPN